MFIYYTLLSKKESVIKNTCTLIKNKSFS